MNIAATANMPAIVLGLLEETQAGLVNLLSRVPPTKKLDDGHTIGGLAMARLRHLPGKNGSIELFGYRFRVEDAIGRLVRKIMIEAT